MRNTVIAKLFKKPLAFLRSPAHQLPGELDAIRSPLVLAGIAAAVMTGTIAVIGYLLSFVIDGALFWLIFLPLLITAPYLGATVGGLMAFAANAGQRNNHRYRVISLEPSEVEQPEEEQPA